MKFYLNPVLSIFSILPFTFFSICVGIFESSPALASHLECKKVFGKNICVRVPDDPTIPQKIEALPSSPPKPVTPPPLANALPAPNSADYYANYNYTWKSIPTPRVSKRFSSSQRQIIWEALDRLQKRVTNDRVLTCIKKYVTKDYEGRVPQEMVKALMTSAAAKRTELWIDPFNENGTVLGRAGVGILQGDNLPYKITLNTYALDRDSSPDTWAGVIIHEMLHNVRWNHSTDLSQVPGNFVYESGWCIQRAGADKNPGSFGLTGDAAPGIGGAIAD